jgi:hypothetical protein
MMVGVEQPEEHDKLADQMEREGDQMEQRADQLGDEISDVRDDWQRKRSDEGVPGAPPPEGDASESNEGAESEASDDSEG